MGMTRAPAASTHFTYEAAMYDPPSGAGGPGCGVGVGAAGPGAR
jgi:hypothetical protein